jgi:prepilin-type N-terminal cleavage/methylation domain-containing protein
MYNHSKTLKGFSLVEMIIAIGIFTMAMSSFAFLGVEAFRTLRTAQNRITASQKSKEVADLIMLVKNESWANIVDHTDDGIKYILNTNGSLSIEDGEKVENELTYFFTIGIGYRDENGNLVEVEEEQYEDFSTRIIDLTIIFDNSIFGISEYNTKIYINNWNTLRVTQESAEDFEEGNPDGTEILSDGAIELTKMSLGDIPDWCMPQLTHSVLPLDPRSRTFSAHLENLYIARGESAQDPVFSHVRVIPPLTREESPELIRIGSFLKPLSGPRKSNNIYLYENYIYTANPNEASHSVWIINVAEQRDDYTPEVGWYSVLGKPNTTSVFAYENYGFVSYQNKIDIFDISEKIGLRSKLNTITIGTATASIKDIVVKDNYIFLAMTDYISSDGSPVPLAIVDISNINNPQTFEFKSCNSKANTVFISEDTNTVYIGTNASTADCAEFFVIDITNKSTPSEIARYNTNGMNILDIVIIQNRAILGGSGTSKYIVLRLDNLEQINQCGQLDNLLINGDVIALDVITYENRLFTYILTRSGNNNEMQIIEGGLGLEGIIGDDYINYGEYFSKIFDLNLSQVRLYSTHIYGEEPEGTNLKVQLRIGSETDLSDANWFGPDGTIDSHFTVGHNEITLPAIPGRYLQYRIIMTSNDIEKSPILDKIEIVYD